MSSENEFEKPSAVWGMVRRNSKLNTGSMVGRNSDFGAASMEDRLVVLCVRRSKEKSGCGGNSIPCMGVDIVGPENEESG